MSSAAVKSPNFFVSPSASTTAPPFVEACLYDEPDNADSPLGTPPSKSTKASSKRGGTGSNCRLTGPQIAGGRRHEHPASLPAARCSPE